MGKKKPKSDEVKPMTVLLRVRKQPNYKPPCATVWLLHQEGAALSQISWGEVLLDKVEPLLAWAKEKGIEVELATDNTEGEPSELAMVPTGHGE